MEAVPSLSHRSWARRSGHFLFLTGFLIWTVALPFAQIQTHRITSIGLITLLVGFVLTWYAERWNGFRVGPKAFSSILPWLALALLPLLHGWDGKENGKDLVLRLPYVLVPFALAYMRKALDFNWIRWGLIFLTLGVTADVLHILSQGPEYVYDMVRSDDELGTNALSWISRPYLGFWLGALLLAWPMVLGLKKSRFSVGWSGAVLVVLGLMFLLLTKLAMLSLAVVLLGLGFWFCRNQPRLLLPMLICVLLGFGLGTWKISRSVAWQEFRQEGGINFTTLSKTYANSINNRMLLWRSSLDVARSPDFPWNGWSGDLVQEKLDEALGRYNGYLVSRHLNSHNQLLYLFLRFGWPGLVVFFLFWWALFRAAFRRKSSWEMALLLFVFLCSQTENYLDREMGVQAFLLFLFLFPGSLEERKPKSTDPPF